MTKQESIREYRTGEIAERLKVHENTIRAWADSYSDLLTARANGAKRKFTNDDLLILATVAEYRDKGLSFDAIRDVLVSGQRIAEVPEIPTPEAIEARESVALIALPEYERALDNIKQLQSELTYTKQALSVAEADKTKLLESAQIEREQLRNRLIEVEKQLAAEQAKLSIINTERRTSIYWLQIMLVLAVGVAVITALIVFLVMR